MGPTPGWYGTPDSPGTERWWDGSTWTEHTRPTGPVEPQKATVSHVAPTTLIAAAPSNGMATAGMVFGILALLVNLLTIPSILGFIFSLVGIANAKQLEAAGVPRSQSGRGRAVGGVWMSVIGFVLGAILTAIGMAQFNANMIQLNEQLTQFDSESWSY